MAEHGEFPLGDFERLLLQRVDRAVRDEEPDQVARGTNRQRAEDELLVRPFCERALPGQIEQRRGVLAQAESWERGRERGVGQSFFRRYVVTPAS